MTFWGSKFLAAKMRKPGKPRLMFSMASINKHKMCIVWKYSQEIKEKKTQNKPNKISDLKITLAKGLSKCKTKNCKKVFLFCGQLYEYTSRWYFNLVDVLFISPKTKTGNPWGVYLSPKSASVKYPTPAVVFRLVKNWSNYGNKASSLRFLVIQHFWKTVSLSFLCHLFMMPE